MVRYSVNSRRLPVRCRGRSDGRGSQRYCRCGCVGSRDGGGNGRPPKRVFEYRLRCLRTRGHNLKHERQAEENSRAPPAGLGKDRTGLVNSDESIGRGAGSAEAGRKPTALTCLEQYRRDQKERVDYQYDDESVIEHLKLLKTSVQPRNITDCAYARQWLVNAFVKRQ